MMPGFFELQSLQHPTDSELFTARLFKPHIVPDTDMKSNALLLQILQPVFADELPVCHYRLDAPFAKELYKLFHHVGPFLGVGVAFFSQQLPKQRKGNALVTDTEHKDIDVCFAELPVGSVDADNQVTLAGQQGEQQPGNRIFVDGKGSKETLDASHSDELIRAGLSIPYANRSKQTVCILHKAVRSNTKNLMPDRC